MADLPPRRCGLVWCGSTTDIRQFVTGDRCPDHTPSREAGVAEPDVLLARHRARLAELANSDVDALYRGVPRRDESAAT